jgi:cyclomaltodextrinase / maltogenic alpha-amylase / neopullulanase
MPGWIQHAVFWQIYPLGFVGAEAAAADRSGVAHRLGHLASWLEYAVELGASGLLLGPIFASSTHGYDTVDYFKVDPRLGDEADFDALIATAHRKGLRVVLDGVFNHVGREFPAFQRVIADPTHADAAWFRRFERELNGQITRICASVATITPPSKAIINWWRSTMTNRP